MDNTLNIADKNQGILRLIKITEKMVDNASSIFEKMDEYSEDSEDLREMKINLQEFYSVIRCVKNHVIAEQQRLETEEEKHHLKEIFNSDMLSEAAKEIIIDATEGPLHPRDLYEFLIDKTWNKPDHDVLPIARQFTDDVEALQLQLRKLKISLHHCHLDYIRQRKLDISLIYTINKLLKSMKEERDAENKERKYQNPITTYMKQ